jgi:hypothetical protein
MLGKPNPNLVDIHLLRSSKQDGWTLETWTSGENYSPFARGITCYLRVTPPNELFDNCPSGTATIDIRRQADPTSHHQTQMSLDLQSVSRDPADVIVTDSFGVSSRGGLLSKRGWEMKVIVLKEGQNHRVQFPLTEGQYLLNVELEIEKGPAFAIKDVPFAVVLPYK